MKIFVVCSTIRGETKTATRRLHGQRPDLS